MAYAPGPDQDRATRDEQARADAAADARNYLAPILGAQLHAAMLDAIAGLDLDAADVASGAYYAASTTADLSRAPGGARLWGSIALVGATSFDIDAALAAVAAADPGAAPAPCGGQLLAAVEAHLRTATGFDAETVALAAYIAAGAIAGSDAARWAADSLVAVAGSIEAALAAVDSVRATLAAEAEHEVAELAARLAVFGPVAIITNADGSHVINVRVSAEDDAQAISEIADACGAALRVTRHAPAATAQPTTGAAGAANDGGARGAQHLHQHQNDTPPASSPRPTRNHP